MADQNDNNDDLVGNSDSLDWRDVLHEHLNAGVGKTYTFSAPRSERVSLFALRPSAFEPSKADIDRFMAEISAMPSTVMIFEDGEPDEILGREIAKDETPREHNERKYPDLMRRLDRLAKRPLRNEGDDR